MPGPVYTETQENKPWPLRSPDQTRLLVLKGLLRKRGASKAHGGAKTPAAVVLGTSHWHDPL